MEEGGWSEARPTGPHVSARRRIRESRAEGAADREGPHRAQEPRRGRAGFPNPEGSPGCAQSSSILISCSQFWPLPGPSTMTVS